MALPSTLSGEDTVELSGLGSLTVCSLSKCQSGDGLVVLGSAETWGPRDKGIHRSPTKGA